MRAKSKSASETTGKDDGLTEADFDEISWYQMEHLGAQDARTVAVRRAIDARDYRRALRLVLQEDEP